MRQNDKIIKTIIVTTFSTIIIIITVNCAFNYYNRATPINDIEGIIAKDVEPIDYISCSDFGLKNITCTGMTYDAKNNCYWIADCGLEKNDIKHSPKLIMVDEDFSSVIETIDLTDVVSGEDNLQGIAFDSKDENIWIAIGSSIVEIDYDGSLQKIISLGRYKQNRANGICYDNYDDTLWVLCYNKYILHYEKNGNLITSYKFNFSGQDHISVNNNELFITIGADYRGENNYVCAVSRKNGVVLRIYRVIKTYAEEGICFNGEKALVANDGFYHDALRNESYISVFDSSLFLR